MQHAIALDAIEVTEADIRAARRAYYGNVSYVDEWLGRLRAALDESGLGSDTVVLFVADHGDNLGEHGLWYKMSFYEWSVRVPLIIHAPGRLAPRRVARPVSQVDIAPSLLELAAGDGARELPDPIDPLDGTSLLGLCAGEERGPERAVSEYLAEGTRAPMLMIRRGQQKYSCCPGDPEQLFDLAADPDETANLAAETEMASFRLEAQQHWDVEAVRLAVIADQQRRVFLNQALRQGRYTSWDYQPRRDAAEEYARSHRDLTDFDIHSRWPRPVAFEPRWR